MRVIITGTALVCGGLPARAVNWDGGPSGVGTDWHTGANWVGDAKPGTGDTAAISVANASVVVTSDERISTLQMGTTANVQPQTLTLLSGTFTATNTATGISYIGQQRGTYCRVRQEGGTAVFGGPGTTAPSQHLFLGGYRNATYGGTGIWELVAGELRLDRSRSFYVGYTGAEARGELHQSGGRLDLTGGGLLLGQGVGTFGLYVQSGGTNVVNAMTVGSYGMGVVTQSMGLADGLATASGSITVGVQPGSTGTYVLQGGTLRSKTMTVGFNSTAFGRFVQTDGIFTNTEGVVLSDGNKNAGTRSEADLSGGVFTCGGYLSVGSGSACTGSWVQAAAEVLTSELRVGTYGVGSVRLDSGSLTVGGLLRVGMYASAEGTLEVRGGTISVGADLKANDAGKKRLHIVGAGCTQFAVADEFLFSGGTGATWRVDLDGTPQGVTRIDAGNSSTVAGVQLEVGILEGVVRRVGETFELLRVPQSKTITTTDFAVTSLDAAYAFEASVLEASDGYDKLLLTCTVAPAAAPTGTLVIVR